MNEVVITRLSETKKGRHALFSEDGFLFSLDEETFYHHPIKEGDILSSEELENLRSLSDTRKAVDKALSYLDARSHGSSELYRKLLTKFDAHSAAAAVARMQQLGLLDDEKFARQYGASLKAKGKSRREVTAKLAEKGIDRDIAAAAAEELFDAGDELEGLRALVQKQYLRKLAEGKRQNVMAALARRGFGSSDIRQVLDEFSSGAETEESWESF